MGTTGSGKTELLRNLTQLRDYSVIFATKPRDETMLQFMDELGFEKYEKWPDHTDPDKHPRRIIWPDASQINSTVTQAQVLADAFNKIYREGGWNLFLDEGWYITNELGLGKPIRVFLLQARSLDISLTLISQRPVSVPVEVFDQATHLFFFRENDFRNLERIGGVAWRNARPVRELVAGLDKYQFLYVNTRDGSMLRSRTPVPRKYVPKKEKGWFEK